ncbi:Cyclic nucleotide-binding domain-containing protein [Plasmodiophora brassicae]
MLARVAQATRTASPDAGDGAERPQQPGSEAPGAADHPATAQDAITTSARTNALDRSAASEASLSKVDRFKALALAEGKKKVEEKRVAQILSSDAIVNTFAEALRSAVEDRHREVVVPWYVLMPDHPVKRCWEVCLIGLLAYTISVLPIRVAFHPDTSDSTMDTVIDFVFFFDLVLTFVTAYEDADGELVVSPKQIALSYVKGWFLVDLVASFPYSLVLPHNGVFSTVGAIGRGLKIPRITLRLLRMVKMLRARRFQKLFYDLEYNPHVHQGIIRAAKLLLVMLVVGHFAACLWIRIGLDADPDQSWFDRSFHTGILDQPQTYQYLVALYWAWQTLCTVGYGDVTGDSTEELLTSIVVITLGATVFSYITATISSILQAADKSSATYRERMHLVSQFLAHKRLPPSLQTRVVRELGAFYRREHKAPADYGVLLADMTPELRHDIIGNLYQELLKKSEFFKLVSNPSLETDVLSTGETIRVRPGQYIATYGFPCDFWYLVVKGHVAAVSSGNSSIVYQKFPMGASVGEVGMFLTNTWVYSLRSLGESTLLKVPLQTMFRIFGTYEGVTNKMLEKAERDLSNLIRVKRTRQDGIQAAVRSPAAALHEPSPATPRQSGKWNLGAGSHSRESSRDASISGFGVATIGERLEAMESAVRVALQQINRLKAGSLQRASLPAT